MPRHTMRKVWIALVTPLLLGVAGSMQAQAPGQRLPVDQRGDPMSAPQRRVDAARRDSLMLRVRERMGEVMRRQLQLSDEQARRLRNVSARLEPRRRALVAEELAVRAALRAQIAAGDSASDPEITSLLTRMIEVQRSRAALMEAEQQELSAFLTPIQRAKYLGIEEQMRLRAEQLQGRPMPGQGPPPGMMPGQGPPGGMTPGMRPRMDRRPPVPE